VTLIRLVTAIAVTVFSAMAAHAEPVVHRSAVPAGEAVAIGGSFSIIFPIPFNDIEIRTENPPAPTVVTHLLTGLDPEGLRVSAMEMTGPEHPGPIDGLMEAAKTRPGTTVSQVSRAQDGDSETLSFTLTEPRGGSYFRVISTARAICAGHTVSRGYPRQGGACEGWLFRIVQADASLTCR
jgi:hypothetical protein